MPKLGRASIGYQRPKKKKVEQPAEGEEDPDDMENEEEAAAGPSDTPIPVADLTAQLARIDASRAVGKEVQSIFKEEERLADNLEKARHAHEVVNRRWRKTMLNYFNDNPMLRWQTPSELQRGLERMQQIDAEHDASEDHVLDCEKEKVCYRKWSKQRLRQLSDRDMDGDIEEAARELEAARASLGVARERPERQMEPGQVLELIARHASMAEAFQWVRLSDIRDDY